MHLLPCYNGMLSSQNTNQTDFSFLESLMVESMSHTCHGKFTKTISKPNLKANFLLLISKVLWSETAQLTGMLMFHLLSL